MSAAAYLIVVVPEHKVETMIRHGYHSTDRSNGRTVTMYLRCESAAEAHQLGYKLPFIWQVESAAAQ